jgi:hypothetical protein
MAEKRHNHNIKKFKKKKKKKIRRVSKGDFGELTS